MTTTELEQRWHRLMCAALEGDAVAYRSLLDELRKRFAAYFGRRLGSALSANADDLVQDTLMAIHTRRATYDRTQKVSAWAFAIARYKLIDHFRRQRIRATVPLTEDLAAFAIDDEPATTSRLDVETVLASIPDRQRQLLRDVRIEGATIAEAAERSGMSETAAKVSIHRALRTLAARFAGGPGRG